LSGRHLTSDIEKTLGQTHRIAGDETTLDQLMRIELHEEPILVGTWLGLVTVHHQIARPHPRRAKAPLHAGRKPSTATAEQARVPNLSVNLLWRTTQRSPQTFIAFGRVSALQRVGVLVLKTRGHDLGSISTNEAGSMRYRFA
jgi:hypothetical protein